MADSGIPSGVAKGVVDVLQTIQVEIEQAQRVAHTPGKLQQSRGEDHKTPAVVQAGQSVGQRDIAQVLVGFFKLVNLLVQLVSQELQVLTLQLAGLGQARTCYRLFDRVVHGPQDLLRLGWFAQDIVDPAGPGQFMNFRDVIAGGLEDNRHSH